MKNKIVVAITAGELSGISGIIILKALQHREIIDIDPIIYGDQYFFNSLIKKYPQFKNIKLNIYDPVNLNIELSSLGRPSIKTGKGAGEYFSAAIKDAIDGKIDAIATAPLDKDNLQKGGFNFTGHTTMLQKLTNSKKVVMMLYGKKLRVALLTIHKPITEISRNITEKSFTEIVEIIHKDMIDRFKIKNPSIAVLGLNPHAGENGKLGKEEQEIFIPTIKKLQKKGINIEGPYPADTYFYKIYKKYDVTLAAYHDQGLIPLKMLHFDDGVNITLGSKVIRTSVDHGTAYDIADSLVASEKSMVNAIKEAYRIASLKSNSHISE